MFWWEDDPEERQWLRELEGMLLERLAGRFESCEEFEWVKRARIWARPPHPEVLVPGLDAEDAIGLLDRAYGLVEETARGYDNISTLFVGADALVTPREEFIRLLSRQAVLMHDVIDLLQPVVDLLYRDYGGRGRVWTGMREALEESVSDPTLPAVARGFEYACTICHTLEASMGDVRRPSQGMPDEPSPESRWCHLVWQETLRSVSACDREPPVSTMRWARLGMSGLLYVDTAERMRCVAGHPSDAVCTAPADAGNWRLVASGPQRVWDDYYLVIEADGSLTDWLGESAYAIASKGGIEVWPEQGYLDELSHMVGSLDGMGFCKADAFLDEWDRLIHAPRALVGECEILLPLDFMLNCGLPSIGVVPGTLKAGQIPCVMMIPAFGTLPSRHERVG